MSDVQTGEVVLDPELVARLHTHVAELTQAVENKLPHVRNLLSIIHKILREDPTVVTIMEPEEIAQLVAGMEVDKGVRIADSQPKSKSSKKLSLDDF